MNSAKSAPISALSTTLSPFISVSEKSYFRVRIITLITSVSAILSNIIKNKPVVKQTYFSLLYLQILIKRGFLDSCQLSYLTYCVLPGLVELHSLANRIAIYGLATAFSATGTSGG